MNDIKLPRLPNVQVPRIDADVSLIDIRVLAKWCQRVATEYARAAVEADRADRAQQEAPTDAEWPAPHSVETVRDANGRARRGSDLYTREAVEEIIAIELGRARYAPAQDAERERTIVQILSEQLAHERAHSERLLKILVGIHNVTMPPLVEANGTRYQFTPPDAVEWLYRLTERIKAIPEEVDAAQRAAAMGEQNED